MKLFHNPDLPTFLYCARNLKADELRQIEALTGSQYDPDPWAASVFMSPWLKWSVFGDDMPVCVGGYQPIRPGVWSVWMLSTPEAWGKHRFAVTRAAKTTLAGLFDNGAHRIECVSLADRLDAHKWYTRCLGFHLEGIIVGWGAKGEDAFMFARTREKT
jgi:hypothetical protein